MYMRLLSVAIIIICALIGWQLYTGRTAYERLQEAPHNQYLGAENPALTITYIMDYRCKFCKESHSDIQSILDEHTDLRIIFRAYPIGGQDSLNEAKMAMAAGMQDRFSDVHEFLIKHQEPVTKPELEGFMAQAGIDMNRFYKTMTSWGATKDLIDTVRAIEAIGISSVPAFIVGKKIYLPEEGKTTRTILERIVTENMTTATTDTSTASP